MSFQFSLQRIMELRQEVVKERETLMERAYRGREMLKQMLAEQRNIYLTEREELNGFVRQGAIEKLSVLEQSLELRKGRMLQILEELRDLESDIGLLEQALIGAKRDLKVVENLKTKRYTEYIRKTEERERKQLDEQAVLLHLRKEDSDQRERRG